jgi:hypothetical protein
MAEQGPFVAFRLLEVPTPTFGMKGVLRHLQEVKCLNTSLRTIDAYMRKCA